MTIKFGRFVLNAVEVKCEGEYVAVIPDSRWRLVLTAFHPTAWEAALVREDSTDFLETEVFEPSAQAAADALESLIRSLAGAVL